MEKIVISSACRKRLHAQGYRKYSDDELNSFKFGIRFAYAICTTLFGLGLLLSNTILLTIVAAVAFLGTFPPYHPFDYLYNFGVRHLLSKPKIPPRPNQGRFACGLASIMLITIILLLNSGLTLIANLLGGMLLTVALLVTTTDICIPSMIYNLLFRKQPG